MPIESIRLPVTLVNEAALDVVTVVRTRAVGGASLVSSAGGCLDTDTFGFPSPCSFAAGASAVEGCKGRKRKEEEENCALHGVLLDARILEVDELKVAVVAQR